jgi:hypothetical protein
VSIGTESIISDALPHGVPRRVIAPTHYPIISYQSSSTHRPKSWYMEVSKDGKEWTEVRRSTSNNDLNGDSLTGTYEVSRVMKCRFVCLRQTGKSHTNNDHFLLSGFEVYGTLLER